MNKEEIFLLLKKYHHTKDKQYRNKIVELMLPYVKYLAYKNSKPTDVEDSIQNGVIGLIKAIENFDTNISDNFVNFASSYIIGEIKRYYRDHSNLIKPPREIYENFHTISQKISELTQKLKRKPTLEELENYTKIKKEKLIEYMEFVNRKYIPLEINSSDGKLETIAQIKNISDEIENKINFQDALLKLDPLEKTVITLKFFEGLTQEEIAQKLNTIQVNISRIQSKALKKLKEALINEINIEKNVFS